MKLEIKLADVRSLETDLLVVNLFQGVTVPGGATGAVNVLLDGVISDLIQAGEITGRQNEITLIHTFGKIPAKRIAVLGLGSRDAFSSQVIRQGMGALVRLSLIHI